VSTPTVEFRHNHNAATKYKPGWHGYGIDDAERSEHITGINILDDGTLSIIGNNSDNDRLIRTARILLSARNINSNVGDPISGSFRKVEVFDAVKTGIIDVAIALSTDVQDPKKDGYAATCYSLLDSSIATEIIEQELKYLKLKASQAGLLDINAGHGREETPLQVVATVRYPHSALEKLREEAYYSAGKNDREAYQVTTRLNIKHDRTAIEKALKDRGYSVTLLGEKSDYHMEVEATADQVMDVLQEGKWTPEFIADEIRAVALESHKDQVAVNHEVAKQAEGFSRKLAAQRTVGISPTERTIPAAERSSPPRHRR
jgi:hypothetical protein